MAHNYRTIWMPGVIVNSIRMQDQESQRKSNQRPSYIIIKWINIVCVQLREARTCLAFIEAKPRWLFECVAAEETLLYF